MKTLQKIEDTWCGVLVHCDAEFDSTPRVLEGWWPKGVYGWHPTQFFGTPTATGTSCTSTATTMGSGTGTTTGSTTTGIAGIRLRFAQLSSFLPQLFAGGVLVIPSLVEGFY